MPERDRYKVLCCEVFFREACLLASRSRNTLDMEFLPKGLHDLGHERMLARLQERVDAVPPDRYEATLLVYGLCNNGVAGLKACHTRLVMPRAHDCMTVFLGSRARYEEVFNANPGTYFRTSGWLERDDASGAGEPTVPQRLGMFQGYTELVEKYGEENAKYIAETMGTGVENYSRLAFIRMGIPDEARFEQEARAEAERRGWEFSLLEGSLDLLRRLLDGDWNDDFLVIEPGAGINPSYGPDVVRCRGGSCG